MPADKPQQLSLVKQPQEFFRELLTEALGARKISPQPETEFYLVNLLNRFMTTENLYVQKEDGSFRDEPLALMVKQALEEPQTESQRLMLRQVGDVSLYTAGFFQESLTRKRVEVDYYVQMGRGAYGQVAVRVDERTVRSMYEELADLFSSFVEALSAISERTTSVRTEKDVLRMYDIWVSTRSARAEKVLKEAGINPQDALQSSKKPQ